MASITNPDPPKYSQESRACKLKAIARKLLLKQYALTSVADHQYRPPSQFATPVRPTMGLKDSDDYITARAANPRTGLISPSPAATPRTPESPAEALKLRSQRTRPALTRANEARKISAGGLRKWCADEHGWSREDAKSGVASPRPSETNVGAADIICGETEALEDTLRGDRFVIHMPSAREPQPYAFPGRSAEEIQAYEHYKQKARKTSGWRPRDHSLSSVRTLVLLCRVCASRLTVWFPCVSIALNVVPTARAAMDAQIDMNGMNTSILAADNEGTGTEFLWGFLMGLLLGVFMLLMVSWHPCKCVEIPLNLQLT